MCGENIENPVELEQFLPQPWKCQRANECRSSCAPKGQRERTQPQVAMDGGSTKPNLVNISEMNSLFLHECPANGHTMIQIY